jgi:hypothetical protein
MLEKVPRKPRYTLLSCFEKILLFKTWGWGVWFEGTILNVGVLDNIACLKVDRNSTLKEDVAR